MSKKVPGKFSKIALSAVSEEEGKYLRSIGRHIASYRVLRGMTQQQLADAVSLSRAYISHLELGQGNPHALTLYRICAVLEIPVGELFKKLG